MEGEYDTSTGVERLREILSLYEPLENNLATQTNFIDTRLMNGVNAYLLNIVLTNFSYSLYYIKFINY